MHFKLGEKEFDTVMQAIKDHEPPQLTRLQKFERILFGFAMAFWWIVLFMIAFMICVVGLAAMFNSFFFDSSFTRSEIMEHLLILLIGLVATCSSCFAMFKIITHVDKP